MVNLRSIASRVRVLTGKAPPVTGAIPIEAEPTAEQWKCMLDLEARLLAAGGPYNFEAEEFLRFMPILRDARQRHDGADEGKPFTPEYGIDIKAELAAAERGEP
jgi:hypothetical protein